MGLFSFLSKNKQASTAEDSGYYSGADEQALSARARSKRASSAGDAAEPVAPRRAAKGGADDPVLPEKKRARRRLVGAIGLALAVAIGLPMILDSEPKPLASDIEIRIPSKAQAVTINGATSGTAASSTAQGTIQAAVPAAGAALDPSEQIIATPPPLPSIVMPATDVKPAPAPMPLPVPKAEAPVRSAESKLDPEPKPVVRVEPTPKAVDSTRALAILEGRPPVKEAAVKEASGFNYVVQVAALATQDKVDELQERLKAAGIDSYTQKISTPAGQRIRVRVGPFGSREEADKALARLARLGLNGSLVPT